MHAHPRAPLPGPVRAQRRRMLRAMAVQGPRGQGGLGEGRGNLRTAPPTISGGRQQPGGGPCAAVIACPALAEAAVCCATACEASPLAWQALARGLADGRVRPSLVHTLHACQRILKP